MGATLDGFVKFFDASGIKGWMAFVRILDYMFIKPWGYAFVFLLGIVCLFLRHKKTQLYIIAMSVCFSVLAFCLVFSMSGAADFEWHLDSLERLLWVPALLLLRECLPLIENGTFGIFKILRNAEHQLATRKRAAAFLLTAVLLGLPFAAFAVTANNVFVTVSSSTDGVEGIFPVGGDFYVTTRGVTNPPFRADIGISANSPYYLVKPSSGRMNLTVGENEEYRVRDESGAEDSFTGRVYVVKIEIEPKETNVCWKASSCKLKLTDDSVPGGVAVWTSNPAGISGSGNSITFNPSALSAGEYTVTAKSGIVPSYKDTCVVRIVKIFTKTDATFPANRSRTKVGIGEEVACEVVPAIAVDWAADGKGDVFPAIGVRTTFSAHRSPGTAIVHARVAGLDCDVVFEIVAPSSITPIAVEDIPLSPIAGIRFVGAKGEFDFRVMPDDVSFYNVEFRENIPGESFVWPAGISGRISGYTVQWSVGFNNVSSDTVSSGLVLYSMLKSGSEYRDFSFDVRVPEEYKNEEGNWILWYRPEKHRRSYKANGETRVGLMANNVLWGGWMGPWD